MGILRAAGRRAFPLSRAGAALWAWRHRAEIGGWAGYVARSAPRLIGGDTADVLAEGRLRARLTADGRTRDVVGLRIAVEDGVATLSGMVPGEVHDVVLTMATNTTGITRVRDELSEPRRGRRRAGR